MSESQEMAGPGESEPGWRERLRGAFSAAADLLATRAEIFEQEAAQKAGHLARGLGGLAAALVTGWLAMLLLAALLVALFTLLFGGRVWAGVLATLILYGGACAAAALYGWQALTKVRPLDFSVTREEFKRDWQAVASRLDGQPEEPEPAPEEGPPRGPDGQKPGSSWDDIEARFRAGSE